MEAPLVVQPAIQQAPPEPSEYAIVCPSCGGNQIMANKKGFGVGKAAVGAVLLGPLGLAGGMIGANTVMLSCLRCGHQWQPTEAGNTDPASADRRFTNARTKTINAFERLGFSVLSIVLGGPIGLCLMLIPVLGWVLGPLAILFFVFAFPFAMLIGDPHYITRLIGDCPHCRHEVSTSIGASFNCNHCQKRVVVREQQFYTF